MAIEQAAIERAYVTRNNKLAFQLYADDVAIDGSVITRALLRLTPEGGGATLDVDSSVSAGVFDWSIGGGVLEIKLGAAPSIPAGRYTARLIIYDATNTAGLVWGRGFTLIYDAV